MKQTLPILSLLALSSGFTVPTALFAGDELLPLRQIAVQDGGRTKPLDSFARVLAKRVQGAKPFGFERVSGLEPIEWLLASLAAPDRWRGEPILKVTHAAQAHQMRAARDDALARLDALDVEEAALARTAHFERSPLEALSARLHEHDRLTAIVDDGIGGHGHLGAARRRDQPQRDALDDGKSGRGFCQLERDRDRSLQRIDHTPHGDEPRGPEWGRESGHFDLRRGAVLEPGQVLFWNIPVDVDAVERDDAIQQLAFFDSGAWCR